jgi:hypothetical protein
MFCQAVSTKALQCSRRIITGVPIGGEARLCITAVAADGTADDGMAADGMVVAVDGMVAEVDGMVVVAVAAADGMVVVAVAAEAAAAAAVAWEAVAVAAVAWEVVVVAAVVVAVANPCGSTQIHLPLWTSMCSFRICCKQKLSVQRAC